MIVLPAGRKWGDDYTEKGKAVCRALHEHCLHRESGIFLTNANAGGGFDWVTRPSDWMLGHLRLFSQVRCHHVIR